MDPVISPSGKYRLTITINESRCSHGVITRISDNTVIAEIDRNYDVFHHSFFMRDGNEWMVTGKTYLTQTFINLDTGQIIHFPEGDENSFSFCWSTVHASPDGKTLAVDGCVWGAPYEIRFYDWTDINKVPKQLTIECDKDFWLDPNEMENIKWTNDVTFEFDLVKTRNYTDVKDLQTGLTRRFFDDVHADLDYLCNKIYPTMDKYEIDHGSIELTRQHQIFYRDGNIMKQRK